MSREAKTPFRIMVSFTKEQMDTLADEARVQERSISFVVNRRAFPGGLHVNQRREKQ
jgi:hypothetical protein